MSGNSPYEIPREEQRKLSLPAVLVGVAICVVMIFYGFFNNLRPSERFLNLTTGAIGILFVIIYFFFIFPQLAHKPYYIWVVLLVNGVSMAWIFTIERYSMPGIAILVFSVIIYGTAVLADRWITYTIVAASMIGIYTLPSVSEYANHQVNWANFLSVPLIAIATIETVHLLKQSIRKQIRRLEAVNQMTRSLVFSIEVPQVVTFMSSAIQSGLDADTYYIGLIHDRLLHLELFYDDGEFFYNQKVSLDDSLIGWVYKHRESLLLRNLPEDVKRLDIGQVTTIGKPKMSLSWMGAPLQTRDHLFGMVAVASYEKNAFNVADMELLENFARQSAITLDNAYHHAEVEQKSTLDSLTGALNHGHLISALEAELPRAGFGGYPVSLIMLDVDHFKRYNDTFGHLVGDRVLIGMVETIKRHIKAGDLLGRWGGEEFAIALINTTSAQALQVAERIHASLRELEITDREGASIQPPTVSQGIATFPNETKEVFQLIDLADQRLYVAKERGRDQIEPVPVSRIN